MIADGETINYQHIGTACIHENITNVISIKKKFKYENINYWI